MVKMGSKSATYLTWKRDEVPCVYLVSADWLFAILRLTNIGSANSLTQVNIFP